MAMMRSEAGKCTKPSFIGMFCHQDLSQEFRVRMGCELEDRTQSSQAMFVCLPEEGGQEDKTWLDFPKGQVRLMFF